MDRSVRDARSLYVSGIGGIAFLFGIAPFVNLVFTPIGLIFAVAAVFGALFMVIARLRDGFNPTKIFLELAIIGGFVFFVLYGVMWYFMSYMPSQPGMWNFQFLGATKVPK